MSTITPLSSNPAASLSADVLARQDQGQGLAQVQARSGQRPELAPQMSGALPSPALAGSSGAQAGAGAVVAISAAARQRMLAEQAGGTTVAGGATATVTVIPGQQAVSLPGEAAVGAVDGGRRGVVQEAQGAAPDEARPGSVEAAGDAEASAEGAQPDEAGAEAELDPAEKAVVQELKARDREVRQHEQAHMSAAGSLATSGPTYSYQRGPDGRNYAIGGEVGISMSPGRTPQETIARAERIVAAALAPAEPSGQDRAVAAHAMQMKQAAMVQAAQEAQQSPPSQGAQAGQHAQALPGVDDAPVSAGAGAGGRGHEAAAQDTQAPSSAAHARRGATAYAQVQQLAVDAAPGSAHRRGSLIEMAA